MQYNLGQVPTHLTKNTNKYKKVITEVTDILDKFEVGYTLRRLYEGYQLLFNSWCQGDLVIHDGSCGSMYGYVETMGFPWDDEDVSMLPPEDAAMRIVKLFESYRESYYADDVFEEAII